MRNNLPLWLEFLIYLDDNKGTTTMQEFQKNSNRAYSGIFNTVKFLEEIKIIKLTKNKNVWVINQKNKLEIKTIREVKKWLMK